MADQNVYDDPVFFANYKKLRENEGSADFSVEKVAEPMPDAATVRRFPKYAKYRHKPDFLLMRVKK